MDQGHSRTRGRLPGFLLSAAWLLLIASLATPALDDTIAFLLVFYPLPYTPVALLILASVLATFRVPLTPYSFVLPSMLIFVASPLFITKDPSRAWSVTRRLLAFVLLGVWGFAIVCLFVATPGQRHDWSCDHIFWGYYLFAIAHTLAFIAIQIGPASERRPDRRRGFPVVIGPAKKGDGE